jgi:hypothetical protein
MQPKPATLPPNQPTLPFEIPRRPVTPPEVKEAIVDRCAPQETWQTLDMAGREQLRGTWIRVLKAVVDDA